MEQVPELIGARQEHARVWRGAIVRESRLPVGEPLLFQKAERSSQTGILAIRKEKRDHPERLYSHATCPNALSSVIHSITWRFRAWRCSATSRPEGVSRLS